MFTFKKSFKVTEGRMAEHGSLTSLLSEFVGGKSYISIIHDKKVKFVDLSMILRELPNIDFSQTLGSFINARLDDNIIEGYYANDKVPKLIYGKFNNRLDAFDGFAEKHMYIAYTDVDTPEVRDDPYRRSHLNDLVITSNNHDLRNCFVGVNGVFHNTIFHQDELFVVNGHCNIRNSDKKLVSVYDTTSIGGHTAVPLSSRFLANTLEQDIKHGVYIKLPESVSLKDKTVLLMVDGHLQPVYGKIYEVVGDNTIKINTNKIDFIHNFLHDPMTHYFHDHQREEEDISNNKPRQTDLMEYYFDRMWPLAERDTYTSAWSTLFRTPWYAFDPCTKHNIQPDSGHYPIYPTPSIVEAMRYYFESVYPHPNKEDNTLAISTIDYQRWYHIVNGIRRMMPYQDLTSRAFLFHRLFSIKSMLIIINNPDVYIRTYTANRSVQPDQYNTMSKDIPRGIMTYNKSWSIPYVVYSAPDGQNTFSLGLHHEHHDVYKTALNPIGVISPMFDDKSTLRKIDVDLTELYAP